MSPLELQVYDLFKKRFSEDEAKLVITYLDGKAEEKYEQKKDMLLTKEDKIELVSKIESSKVEVMKSIYFVGIIQFLAIVGSVLAIISFMLKK
jgi:hypothetical protein